MARGSCRATLGPGGREPILSASLRADSKAQPATTNMPNRPPGDTITLVSLRERLLGLMDRKHHWAYPALTRPGLSRDQLLAHFRHEYLVYVRDFPALLARALGQVPPVDDVRRALAENLY